MCICQYIQEAIMFLSGEGYVCLSVQRKQYWFCQGKPIIVCLYKGSNTGFVRGSLCVVVCIKEAILVLSGETYVCLSVQRKQY